MEKIKEIIRSAWTAGMGSYHDTKTSKQLENELDEYMEDIEDELKSIVSSSEVTECECRVKIEDHGVMRCVICKALSVKDSD